MGLEQQGQPLLQPAAVGGLSESQQLWVAGPGGAGGASSAEAGVASQSQGHSQGVGPHTSSLAQVWDGQVQLLQPGNERGVAALLHSSQPPVQPGHQAPGLEAAALPAAQGWGHANDSFTAHTHVHAEHSARAGKRKADAGEWQQGASTASMTPRTSQGHAHKMARRQRSARTGLAPSATSFDAHSGIPGSASAPEDLPGVVTEGASQAAGTQAAGAMLPSCNQNDFGQGMPEAAASPRSTVCCPSAGPSAASLSPPSCAPVGKQGLGQLASASRLPTEAALLLNGHVSTLLNIMPPALPEPQAEEQASEEVGELRADEGLQGHGGGTMEQLLQLLDSDDALASLLSNLGELEREEQAELAQALADTPDAGPVYSIVMSVVLAVLRALPGELQDVLMDASTMCCELPALLGVASFSLDAVVTASHTPATTAASAGSAPDTFDVCA